MRKIIHRYTVLLLTVLLVGTGIALADTDVVVLGDVNSDGSVTTADVTALVNYLHGSGTVNEVAADVNRDGAIDIADVTAINNIISSGTFDKGTASTLFFPTATVEKSYGDAAFTNQLVRSGSTGAITYTSSATGVATVNTTTGEVTIQGAGTTIITATLAGNGGISGTTASYTVNVAKVAASITTSPASVAGDLTYDGTAQNLVTAGDASGGTLKYFVNTSGEVPTTETDGWTDVVSTGTDADTYYVWYYVAGDANHTNTAVTAIEGNTKAISKFNLTNAAIATEIGDQQYAGAQVTPAAPAIKLGESTIDASNYDVSYGENNSVGTGTVIYTAKAGSANFSGAKIVNFTITSGTLSVTAEDYSGTYDGAAHGITVTCDGATIKYRTTAEGEYNLTENPTYTNAGTVQTVYYQVTKDNYTTVEGSKTVTITQKEVTVSDITASNKTYDGNTTATLDCTGATISGKVGSDELTVTATGTFDDANVGTDKTVTISDITLGGSSVANYKLAASGNQTSTTANVTAASFTPVVTLSGWTYGSPNSPSVGETNTSGGTVTYYYKTGDAEWTTTQPTDAGTHQVKASIAENGNYAAAESAPVEFTITQKTLTITAKAQSISYGSSIATGIEQVTTDGLVDGDALTAVTLTPSTNQVTASGTITPSAAATTKGIENYNVTYTAGNLTINKAAGAATLSSSSVAFGTSTANQTVTVSGNTGTVSASVTSGSGCTVSVSGTTITITRNSNAAFSATITVTIAESTNYNSTTKAISVSGTAVLRNMTSATSGDIGKVICSNGHIHSNVSDVTCGGSASAMIAYVGNQNNANGNGAYSSTYNHGLAIALADVINTSGNLQTAASHTNYLTWENAKTACSSFKGSKPSGVTWMLPSAYQWERMLIGCGSTATYVAYSSQSFGSFSYGNFRTKLTSCGNNTQGVYDVQSNDYWSSSEYSSSAGVAWFYLFGYSYFSSDGKSYGGYVRACYAF